MPQHARPAQVLAAMLREWSAMGCSAADTAQLRAARVLPTRGGERLGAQESLAPTEALRKLWPEGTGPFPVEPFDSLASSAPLSRHPPRPTAETDD